MSLPQSLMFTVGLVDQITKPIAKISKGLNGLTNDYQAGTMKMASGVAGIAASSYALYEALQPALEIDKALGEAKGAGLTDEALKVVTKTATDFSLKFGKSSVDVIKHAEKMHGVFGNVSNDVLASVTNSSATLAMAVQSDADSVSKYFKNIYGNNGDIAKSIGQEKFVQQITSMTAHAKKNLGIEFEEIEGMIDGMHSLPSTLGVPLEEQFAILSMLNKQMGQGDAVTQFTNYLENIGAAQEKLGVNLTDSKGKMLPFIEVVKKLKPLIDGKSGDQAWKVLDDAGLGDASLMIINAAKNVDDLKQTLKGYKGAKEIDAATQSALDMTVQSERLQQSWFVIRAAFGSAILPAFNDFVGLIADMGSGVLSFTEEFPTLTKWLGYAAVGVLSLVAAGGLISVVMGAATMATTAWNTATMIGRGISTAFTASLAFLRGAMLAVNLVMYANPIGLIVAGITLAIAAIGALVYYWDDLKATMGEWGWIKAIGGIFSSVWGGIKSIFNDTMDWIIDKLNMIPGVDIDTNIASTSVASISAIEPIRSKAEKGGITQQISNANQQKSTSVGTVNVYPAKGESNFLNFVEMQS